MSRTLCVTLSCLLGLLACGAAPPDAGKAAANKQAAKPAAPAKVDPAASPPVAEVKPVEQPPVVEPPPVEPAAVDPDAVDPDADPDAEPVDAGEEPPAEIEPPADPSKWTAPPGVDIRSDAAIPPGTPAENAAAFKALSVSKADGPPVSAIAANGLHFDVMVVGRGFEKSRCVEPTDTFTTDVDDKANICLRAVHPPDVEEVLTVEWSKNGSKAKRRSTVTIKAMHAYLTRSYLPIKSGYEGVWTATIKAPDETVLGEVSFTVE